VHLTPLSVSTATNATSQGEADVTVVQARRRAMRGKLKRWLARAAGASVAVHGFRYSGSQCAGQTRPSVRPALTRLSESARGELRDDVATQHARALETCQYPDARSPPLLGSSREAVARHHVSRTKTACHQGDSPVRGRETLDRERLLGGHSRECEVSLVAAPWGLMRSGSITPGCCSFYAGSCTSHAQVYDITKFLHDHPGGPETIVEVAGRECTEQ
jgi:hypothetical protein